MAVCGDQCSVQVNGGTAFEGHRFTITGRSPSVDVRAFGSGDYGSWISCTKDGNITINSYDPPAAISPGTTATLIMTIDATDYTATDAICEEKSCDVDAKGIVEWTTTWRIQSDITNF